MVIALEKETNISFSEVGEAAYIWTESPVMMGKLIKIGLEPIRVTKGQEASWEFECPKGWIKVKKPRMA